MHSERLWIAVLAATFFLAGGAGGILFALRLDATESSGPFAAYHARLVRAYDLDEVGAKHLERVLAEYDREIEALRSRHIQSLEPELVQAGRTCRRRIRYIIPPDRLPEFDRLTGVSTVSPASPQ